MDSMNGSMLRGTRPATDILVCLSPNGVNRRYSDAYQLASLSRARLEEHGQEMVTIGSTRLIMCAKLQKKQQLK